ncbi:hypothetical protein [Erythrobacter sp. SD-21]|uniref:hypothetical protein n=1 Tax=Erythrobacter sp. SD-21 TaxID=161528 RepID=UPI0012EADF3F|nr:hypothetical protein [Erythrobacter sp. SD-21]
MGSLKKLDRGAAGAMDVSHIAASRWLARFDGRHVDAAMQKVNTRLCSAQAERLPELSFAAGERVTAWNYLAMQRQKNSLINVKI